jgi:thymidylate synthase (FAD)|tara:strand:- start:5302 stop:6090 length:789 start_codon:yes stop_codon:yes gene_type:complete
MNIMEKVLDHGFVRLVDYMPQQDLDSSIVQAARVSYGDGTKTSRGDRGLIRYLLRHWHTTPFEMVEFKFHIKMPIYIARQHMRHRTASINELSARYSVVPKEYYEPDVIRGQSQVNHQGSEGVVEIGGELNDRVSKQLSGSFDVYETMLDSGACREQSRGVLPQSTYTEFYWKINLHNLLHYLQLRMEPGAQKEIRDYATAIYELVKPLVPITMEAFVDFRVNAIQLTGPEIEAIANGTTIASPGERREFEEKLKRLKIKCP